MVAAAAAALNAGQADHLIITGVLGSGTYGVVYAGEPPHTQLQPPTLLLKAQPLMGGAARPLFVGGRCGACPPPCGGGQLCLLSSC